MESSLEETEVRLPKTKEESCRLRWEIKHKMTKRRHQPLTHAQIAFRKLQIAAFEKVKLATGGRPFKVLKEKIDAVPQKTAEAVVKHLTSLDNTHGLSPEEQLQEDQLKIAVLQGRVNRNAKVVAKQKGPKIFGGPGLKHFLTPKRPRREQPAPSASSAQSVVTVELSDEELKRQWLARERAAQAAQDKLQKKTEMEERKKKREWEAEHRCDHQCLGCKKYFVWEEEYHEHMRRCSKFLDLPVDKFGFRLGEEPSSPTLKKVWSMGRY